MDYQKSFDSTSLSLPQFQGQILFIPSKEMSFLVLTKTQKLCN